MSRSFRCIALAMFLSCVATLDSETFAQEVDVPLSTFPAAEIMPPLDTSAPLLEGPIVEQSPLGDGLEIPSPQIVSDPSWLPDWCNPMVLFAPVWWDGTFELGINGSEGNAEAFSIRSGFELSRETDSTNWDVDFTYGKTEAGGVETQHNALLFSNWDYKLANPAWSWFNKVGFEYDEFKDFDWRFSYNTGVGYFWFNNDITQLRGRFGLGTSREFDSADDDWKPEAVFGFDFSRQISATQKFSVVFDYFPTWDDFSDYRIITDAGWEVVISTAANLSLKLGVIDRYDSTPGTRRANDIDYSILLLWTI